MAIIKAPNKDYTGVSAGVSFVKGEAKTEDKWLIQWFEKNGYKVENKKPEKKTTATKKKE